MGFTRLVLSIFFLFNLIFYPMISEAKKQNLKTINVSMPTNFGLFLGEIHYSKKDHAIALKVERVIKEDLIKVINYFEYIPKDIVHFNIDPYLRLTNGSATTIPTNLINLYNFPAGQLEHLITLENWMQGLVVHEYIHITHLDQTRDIWKNLRRVFGTIAKAPVGITPRWFTEGIAVWGESNLLGGGRLNNELFNKELLIQFKKNDFCKTIDCLDEPGNYPYGSLAYWAGAQFIQYLENKDPGTVKCLVEQNSGRFPFTLNTVFKACTAKAADVQFNEFREYFINNQPPLSLEKEAWGEKISNVFGVDDYQKGHVLDGDFLFKVEHDRKKEALVSYDLEDQVNHYAQYEWPISDIVGMVRENDEKYLLVAFNDEPNYRNRNRSWKLINPDTLFIEKSLTFAHDPTYVLPITEGYLTFSYWNNRWIAEINDQTIKEFSTDQNIVMAKLVGNNELLLKINDGYGSTVLVLSDIKLTNLRVLYKSANVFDLPIIDANFAVLREKESVQLLEWDQSKPTISTIPKENINRISFASFNESRVLCLENRLKTSKMNKSDIIAFIKKGKGPATALDVAELKIQPGPTSSFASNHAESFPRPDHYIPHWWFLAFSTAENLQGIGVQTSLSDPMFVNTLSLTGIIYEEAKVGGSLTFSHKAVEISDLWRIEAALGQEYSKATIFSENINLDRSAQIRTYYAFLMDRWTYLPGVFASYTKARDFISERSTTNLGLSQELNYKAMTFSDFFQYLNSSLKMQNSNPNTGEDFFSSQITADSGVRFSERFMVSLKGSYGRLYKSDFVRGVLYGGGVNSPMNGRAHEFYGVPYNDAWGNEIFTARLTLDYNFWYIYKGKNLWPIYFKEAHLILGRESMYADRILIDNKLLSEKMINSFFIGPRLKMQLFYLVPVNVDLIYSKTLLPDGNDVNNVNFMIHGDFYF